MKKVFIYVGHSNWGKSRALRIIAGDSDHRMIVEINSEIYLLKRMSNDDDRLGLLEWVCKFKDSKYQRFIIAFCPKFDDIGGRAVKGVQTAKKILKVLQKTTEEIYFFVQRQKFNDPLNVITDEEIEILTGYGKVEILDGHNEASVRASKFREFILENEKPNT